jgi:hypothetical protein
MRGDERNNSCSGACGYILLNGRQDAPPGRKPVHVYLACHAPWDRVAGSRVLPTTLALGFLVIWFFRVNGYAGELSATTKAGRRYSTEAFMHEP